MAAVIALQQVAVERLFRRQEAGATPPQQNQQQS